MINKIWNDEPWMKQIDQDLLYRLWKKKGSPNVFLRHTKYGVSVKIVAMPGIGELRSIKIPHRYPPS